ncbi:MAG: hypothetical protein Q8L52_01825 [bacterium]|nr:hypothetical protein [bacterium]
MNEMQIGSPNRAAVVNTLAVVGFIALIGASMWLAVYSTRYVPSVVNGAGSAAVYLGSIFNRSTASLSVVPAPTASSTIISFGDATSTTETPVTPQPVTQESIKKIVPIVPTAGQKTTNTYQMGSATTTGALIGLPDLVTSINAVGYLAKSSSDSFVATSSVPTGSRPAVSFTIKNVGTNVTGPWCFSATIPTQSHYLYQSQPQQSLSSGDSIDYTLGFDQTYRGTDQMISVTANTANPENTGTCARAVTESTANNNSASAKITILGS